MPERLSTSCFTNSVITFLSPSLTHQILKEYQLYEILSAEDGIQGWKGPRPYDWGAHSLGHMLLSRAVGHLRGWTLVLGCQNKTKQNTARSFVALQRSTLFDKILILFNFSPWVFLDTSTFDIDFIENAQNVWKISATKLWWWDGCDWRSSSQLTAPSWNCIWRGGLYVLVGWD